MKVRLLRDWSFYRAGETHEVFEPTARNWIHNGIAEDASVERRDFQVERAVDGEQESAEKAVRKPTRKP